MDDILEKFAQSAVKRAGLVLFSGSNALLVIDEACRRNVEILGIDGIFLFESATQPSMEDSIDFTSANARTTDVYAAARNFVEKHDQLNLFFEIVFA